MMTIPGEFSVGLPLPWLGQAHGQKAYLTLRFGKKLIFGEQTNTLVHLEPAFDRADAEMV